MVKNFKNKESEKKDKDATVDEDDKSIESKKDESKSESKKTKTGVQPSLKGRGGQFVDIGGGVRVPASEVKK